MELILVVQVYNSRPRARFTKINTCMHVLYMHVLARFLNDIFITMNSRAEMVTLFRNRILIL